MQVECNCIVCRSIASKSPECNPVQIQCKLQIQCKCQRGVCVVSGAFTRPTASMLMGNEPIGEPLIGSHDGSERSSVAPSKASRGGRSVQWAAGCIDHSRPSTHGDSAVPSSSLSSGYGSEDSSVVPPFQATGSVQGLSFRAFAQEGLPLGSLSLRDSCHGGSAGLTTGQVDVHWSAQDAHIERSSWFQSAVVVLGEAMGTGAFGLPFACSRLGWIMGLSACIFCSGSGIYAGGTSR